LSISPFSVLNEKYGAAGVAEVLEFLPSNHKALSSNSSPVKKISGNMKYNMT
jgi:hypothetical protein